MAAPGDTSEIPTLSHVLLLQLLEELAQRDAHLGQQHEVCACHERKIGLAPTHG